MLISLLSPTIETLINQVVKLDPMSRERLLKLDQKVIKFELTDLKQQLFFIIDEDYILVKADTDKTIDAELSGSSFAFFKLASQEQGSDSLFKGEVRFAGEIGVAQRFQAFFEQLDIDWEEHLSKFTGDIVAHQAFQSGKKLHNWALDSLNTAKLNFSEYVRFEAKVSPASIELENFYDEVADLRSDVERLELRVNRLLHRK